MKRNPVANIFRSPKDDPSFVRLVRGVLIALALGSLGIGIALRSEASPMTLPALAILLVLSLIALLLTYLGILLPARIIVPVAIIAVVTLTAYGSDGLHDIAIIAYPVAIIFCFLLMGRAGAVTSLLAVASLIFVGVTDISGRNTSPLASFTTQAEIAAVSAMLLATIGIVYLFTARLNDSVRKARTNEAAQIEANKELRELQSSLEQRVAERTTELALATQDAQRRAAQLDAISEVARTVTQFQDVNELLPAITRLISEHLGFYHVGVFLLDEKREYAVLRAANSPGGQRMLGRGHRLPVGQVGIVGYVAERAEPRISLDVGADAIFFDNPDLPNTHSEMALPLVVGKDLIGVLDVQSEQEAAFAPQDAEVMSTLADQVAIAIENARQFSETRQALTEARAIYGQYLRQAWQQISLESKAVGYQYANTMVAPLSDPLDYPEIQSAVVSGQPIVQTDQNPAFAVPLKLRGEVIGVLDIRSAKPSHQWSENEQALVQAIAERVALAIENARLFDETTRRADRERTVAEITTQIRSTTDPQEMLQTALNELKRVLGASDIRIRSYVATPEEMDAETSSTETGDILTGTGEPTGTELDSAEVAGESTEAENESTEVDEKPTGNEETEPANDQE